MSLSFRGLHYEYILSIFHTFVGCAVKFLSQPGVFSFNLVSIYRTILHFVFSLLAKKKKKGALLQVFREYSLICRSKSSQILEHKIPVWEGVIWGGRYITRHIV